MTQRDSAAVGVHVRGIVGQSEPAEDGQHLGRKSLVDFDDGGIPQT